MLNSPEFFNKLDTNSLFFIFYYMEVWLSMSRWLVERVDTNLFSEVFYCMNYLILRAVEPLILFKITLTRVINYFNHVLT